MKSLLAAAAGANGSPWTYVDLYHYPDCDPLLASPNMSDWNRSPAWQRAVKELSKPKPRLLVHQHHCSPGLGTYLLPQLNELKREISQRNCSLVLATVLREPVSRFVSQIHFNRVPYSQVRGYAEQLSDVQVKYIMFGHWSNWPRLSMLAWRLQSLREKLLRRCQILSSLEPPRTSPRLPQVCKTSLARQ